MAAFRLFLLRASILACATTVHLHAHAGALDPSTLRDELEDRVLDGDLDAEDLAAMRAPPPRGLTRRRASVYLSLAAFGGAGTSGGREYGGLLTLQLPLERFVAGPHHARSPAQGASSIADDRVLVPLAPSALVEPSAGDRVPSAGPVVVTTEVARSCVRAAWRALGIADDGSIDSLAARARSSAALPELRLRALRTLDESGKVVYSDADPYHYTETGAATNWVEARLTFRLDRLLFADDEVSLERIRLERTEARSRSAAKVLQALFEWQRAYALVAEPALSTAEHFAAVLRELEASAVLDVMTDGWFGRFHAGLAHPSP